MIDLISYAGYVIVTTLVGAITAAVIYARWNYGKLERIKGLPYVIPPAFVGGSDPQIYKKVVHDMDSQNVARFGKLFGFYEGRQAQIYVADPELLKHILVKDFDHFHNKRIMDFGHELINEMLDVLPYDKWKVVRQLLSPTLTTGKLKSMSISMTEAIDTWIGSLKEKMDKTKDTTLSKQEFTALTCDVIARCGFGMRLNSLDDPSNVFVEHTQQLVGGDFEMNFMVTVIQMFPNLASYLPLFPPDTLLFFRDLLRGVMKQRRETKSKQGDFIDCLNEMYERMATDEYKSLGITENTIMAQALIFFLAGFETTAHTLTFLAYNLARNPSKQEKLIEEVDAYLARHSGKVEHETVNELTYMNACVQETLRMFAPLIRLERVCTRDWTHEATGLQVPKGMVIQIPIHSVHYNPEYYPDPQAFIPERFMPENKDKLNPYAYLSFGQGNHNCIGMRFAKEEIFLTVTKVIQNFKFKETAETKIKFKKGLVFLFGVEPFKVEAVKRY